MSRTGLARALSKLGLCSRSQGVVLVRAGRVMLNGKVCRDPEKPVLLSRDTVKVSGEAVVKAESVYLMLNKPRGLVTTNNDDEGRETVFSCFKGAPLPFLSPVGRLDKASEGLLLFTNDTAWAHGITAPEKHLAKTYHVQVTSLVDAALLARLHQPVIDAGERLVLEQVTVLRTGEKNTWLQIVLEEGRNRQIRRVLKVHGLDVLRLVRVSIGALLLGSLAKGAWRHLTTDEVKLLRR